VIRYVCADTVATVLPVAAATVAVAVVIVAVR
jgi:hypothetical protein